MKALFIEKQGAIADLKPREVPVPALGPNDVLVRIEAAGINPSDVGSAQGKFPVAVLPRILGRDFAGTVEKGPADLLGSAVWGSGGDLGITRDGTHAEYISLPRQAVVLRPKNLSIAEAATVGVPFIAAFSALVTLGNVKPGECVLVSGAAGAVGQAAVQVAHAKGARIVALVRDVADRWISNLPGVVAVVLSEKEDLAAVVRQLTNGEGADLALNGVGSSIFASLLAALAPGGRQVVYSAAGGREFALDIMSFYRNRFSLFGLDTQHFDATECASILSGLAPLFESGALKPSAISARYTLSEAAQAYDHVAAGKGGKVVFMLKGEAKEN